MPSGFAHVPIPRPLQGDDTEIQYQALDERPMTGISGCLAQPWLHYHNYQCSCGSWDPVNDIALKFWAIYTQRSNFYKVNDLHGTSRRYCSRLLLSTHLWNSS